MVNVIPEKDEFGNFINIIKVQEESRNPAKKTGSNYQARSLDFPMTHAVGTWGYKDFSFPFPIALFSAEWINHTACDGDFFNVDISPDTIVGTITSDVSASDTVLNVSSTVTDNMKVGFRVQVNEGANTDDLGRCIAVDAGAGTITIETAATQAFTAAGPSYVLMSVRMVDNLTLSATSRMELGKDVIGGTYLPANAVIRVGYYPKDTTDKTFSVVIEYKY